jgi:polysaccharide biosynthesis transport protein
MGKIFSLPPFAWKQYCGLAIIAFVPVIGGAQIYLATAPRIYQTSAQLIVDEKRVSVSELGRNLVQEQSKIPGTADPLANQAELVKAEAVLKRALSKLNKNSPQLTTSDIKSNLSVKIVPGTSLLQLNYQNKDSALAADVLNAIAEAMVEENAQAIRREAASVRKFLESEVPKAEKILLRTEIAENNYRRRSGIISPTEQMQSLVSSLTTVEEQERVVSTQLIETKTKVNSLQTITENPGYRNGYTSVRQGQDEQLKSLRIKLIELETKVAESRLRLTENNPTLINLVEQRDSLRALYNQQLSSVSANKQSISSGVASDEISQNLTTQLINSQVELQSIENKLKLLQEQGAKLRVRLAQIPIQQQPLTEFKRKREQATESLKSLQQKLEEARIAEAQLVSSLRIVNRAEQPTSPSSPNTSVIYALAVVLGIASAVGVIVLLAAMENTKTNTEEGDKKNNVSEVSIPESWRIM